MLKRKRRILSAFLFELYLLDSYFFFANQYANTLYIYIFVLLLLKRIKPQGVLLLQRYE